jgi:ABC-type nitrate/sulfonate/bicarbonate transport system substrate-binding protein
LIGGEVDVIEASAGDFISAISKGAQLKAIGLVAEATEYVLWVKPDIQTPQDLAGKRVAVSRLGSASYIWVKAMLEAMHAPSDVTLVPTGDTNASYAAFLTDAVQGYATTPVNRIGEDQSNAHPLGDAGALGVTSAGHFLAVKADYLQSHRDVMVKFLTGYTAATQVGYSNEDLATQSYATHLQKTDPEYLKGVFDTYVHFPAGQGGMPLDPSVTLDLMQKQIQLQRQADSTIQPDEVVATSILDASLMEDVKASPVWRQLWPNGLPKD